MKNIIQNLILVIVLTIAILFSYAYLQNKISGIRLADFYHFLKNDTSSENNSNQSEDGKETGYHKKENRAVWLSYLEFNAYRNSVEENNEETFRKFFQRVLNRSKKCGFNRIIVHVRPFGDALYESGYYPWAACISGKQGKNPGYDPLKIMVEMAHAEEMYIEAWINPYRVSAGKDLEDLSEDNPARIWALSNASASSENDAGRNVLEYNGALYYNPASEEVRELICYGVKEIVSNYDVDGIHMDDYFYPAFAESDVSETFDAQEYKEDIKNQVIEASTTIADWRRNNVNLLVKEIYQTVKEINPDIVFGISPAGNLDNLRSDLEYYTDIDTWVQQGGYVDYLTPQIYWGFTNTQAPFDTIMNQWVELTENTDVQLYIGLQLYRMGTSDKSQSDYEELQKASLITKELKAIAAENNVDGYCFFSYQYLDVDNKTYQFDSNEFSDQRKKILKKIATNLMK